MASGRNDKRAEELTREKKRENEREMDGVDWCPVREREGETGG